MKKIRLACPCLFGLEGLVADELRQMGYAEVQPENGRVLFWGDETAVARANLGLRCAERVMVLLAEFEARSFEELFQGVKGIPWEEWVGREEAFPVRGWSLDSQLHSVPDCQAIIKKAAVEHLKQHYRVEWFTETGATLQIRFSILKDRVSIYLDTSGEGLHKRGYREKSNEAPLKETLAAGMVTLARFYSDRAFCDPMCGSGTILIEAAMIGMKMAPGLNRRFAAEKWGCLPQGIWRAERSRALDQIDRSADFTVAGYDIDPKAVALTAENAAKAGVGARVRVSQQPFSDFAPAEERGTLVCNPPYGERMLEVSEAEALYRQLGEAYRRLPHWRFYVISPSERFESLFGRKADKRRKLYNGMIRCDFFQYFRH